MKKILLALAFVPALVAAQTAVVTPGEDRAIQTKRGTYNVGPRVQTEAACIEEIRKDAIARRATSMYTCNAVKVFRADFSTAAPCPTQPAATTVTQACPTGTVGSWTQTTTYASAPAPTCWTPSVAPTSAPAGACVTIPAAPASTQTVACPAGTTGTSWTQTRTVTRIDVAPYWQTGAWAPTAAPTSVCVPVVTPPPPPGAVTYHFSDCQTGAVAGCVPGSNANPGTLTLPKQNLAGVNVNTLPAGSRLLFKRGGAWNWTTVRLDNRNTSAAAPLTFDAYGEGELPTLRVPSGLGFETGAWENTDMDGGYVLRNLKLDGLGSGQWGVWFRGTIRDAILDGMEITGFLIAVNFQSGNAITGITVRNSHIHHNRSMGMLGGHSNGLIENNLFEFNNFSGSAFNHGIYYSGGRDVVIRGNRFNRNSMVDGVCRGGNLTAHGMIENLTIENNVIEQDNSVATCYGISMNPGYTSAEGFRNLRVVGNTVINTGGNAISASAAPGAIVENNRVFRTVAVVDSPAGAWHSGITIGASDDSQDLPPGGEIVRNNVGCFSGTGQGLAGAFLGLRSGTASGNVVRTGADASTGPCARN